MVGEGELVELERNVSSDEGMEKSDAVRKLSLRQWEVEGLVASLHLIHTGYNQRLLLRHCWPHPTSYGPRCH